MMANGDDNSEEGSGSVKKRLRQKARGTHIMRR